MRKTLGAVRNSRVPAPGARLRRVERRAAGMISTEDHYNNNSMDTEGTSERPLCLKRHHVLELYKDKDVLAA
jgi:hypothetical protein